MPISRRAKVGVAGAIGGMAALCLGFKAPALALFASGLFVLERDWRARHPEFRGGVAKRWQASLEFYRSTHLDPTNRTLHVVGIPLIVGGAVGLFAFSPFSAPWGYSVSSFAAGWLLNLVGHAAYEKRAPAFSEDPLSFVAGPVWDAQQALSARRAGL